MLTQLLDGKDGIVQARWVDNMDNPELQQQNLEKLWADFPNKMSRVNQILKRNQSKFLTGDTVSWIDFALLAMYEGYYSFFNRHGEMQDLVKTIQAGEQNYELFMAFKAIYENERVAAYSEETKKIPFMLPTGLNPKRS